MEKIVISNEKIQEGDFIIDTEKIDISINCENIEIVVKCKEILDDNNLVWESFSIDKKLLQSIDRMRPMFTTKIGYEYETQLKNVLNNFYVL